MWILNDINNVYTYGRTHTYMYNYMHILIPFVLGNSFRNMFEVVNNEAFGSRLLACHTMRP